ncbi:MAG TPA: MOSC domain-containing protein [Gemmataceae bacterium]|nr:MOSC domain-containing protein [Gemmataceae bacterium]
MTTGILRGIWISPTARDPLVCVAEVRAVPCRGLEGDRYFFACGSFSRWPGKGREVSLIAEEALEAVRAERGIDLREGRSRRNLVTSGIDLAHLQERTFRIGTAVFRGVRPCAPCEYLERLTEAGVFEALKGRGGLRADVIEEGILHVGDAIEVLPPL